MDKRHLGICVLVMSCLIAGGTEPVARVEVLADRLAMTTQPFGITEVKLSPTNVVREKDGYALNMPLPSCNFLPATLAGDQVTQLQIGAVQTWRSPAIPVHYTFDTQFPKAGQFGLLFSAYIRSTGGTMPVDVTLNWEPGELAAWEQVSVGREWRRFSVRLPFAENTLAGEATIELASDAALEVRGMQLEPWGAYPVFQQTPTAWMPGESVRNVRPPVLAARTIPMDWQQGAVAVKVRIPEAGAREVSGERTILFVGVFWAGILEIRVDGSWVGKGQVMTPQLRRILADGEEHELLLAWDEKQVRVYADGKLLGQGEATESPIVGSDYQLWIGTHNPRRRNIGGLIRQLRFYDVPVLPAEATAEPLAAGVRVELPVRNVFRRDEENVALTLPLHGDVPADLQVALTGLPGAAVEVVDGALVRITLQPWLCTEGVYSTELSLGGQSWHWPVQIVAAEARDRFPIGNWGSPGTTVDLEWARDLGLGTIDSRNVGADYLNQVARFGLRASVNFRNIRMEPHPATADHLQVAREEARRLVQAVQPFPWIVSCIHNSEGQGSDDVETSPLAMASLKAELGLEAPLAAGGKPGFDLACRPKVDLKSFRETGIVPDDYLPLRYIRWLMTEGGGMNLSSRVLSEQLHEHAPWVRIVQEPANLRYADWADVLSNWRYANHPAPMLAKWRMGLAAAQAAGKAYYPLTGHCYYSPRILLEKGDHKVDVPPSGDMAAAFLWTALALPASEIRCFGWWEKNWASQEALRPGSNARIKAAIAEISRLGPVVGDVPLQTAPLAVFIPETNRLGRASDEWWHAYGQIIYRIVSYFGEHDLPVDILYEEQVLKGALDRYPYVYIPALRYLTASVNTAVGNWREAGGKLILDNHASPAFGADQRAPLIDDGKRGMAFALNEAGGAEWLRSFSPLAPRYARLESGEAIVLTKEWLGCHFVLVINNKWREAQIGQKVSALAGASDIAGETAEFEQAGLVQTLSSKLVDVGEEQAAVISLREVPGVAIYNLRSGQRLESRLGTDGRLLVESTLAPGSAVVLAIYAQPVATLTIQCPENASAGSIAQLGIELRGKDGKLLAGRQGVALEIRDPAGARFDASAVYRLEEGRTHVRLRLPLSAPLGIWQVSGRDVASSLSGTGTFVVEAQ